MKQEHLKKYSQKESELDQLQKKHDEAQNRLIHYKNQQSEGSKADQEVIEKLQKDLEDAKKSHEQELAKQAEEFNIQLVEINKECKNLMEGIN